MSLEYFEVDLNKVINLVKDVLESFKYIEVAVIFGSILRRRIVRDVDIGIVPKRPITIKELARIASKLEEVLDINVDVVPLNEVPPLLRFKALSEGVRVLVRDPLYYHYILLESFMELMDLEITLTTLIKGCKKS